MGFIHIRSVSNLMISVCLTLFLPSLVMFRCGQSSYIGMRVVHLYLCHTTGILLFSIRTMYLEIEKRKKKNYVNVFMKAKMGFEIQKC